MTRIDAHHHFWHPARGDYGWMQPGDPVIWRPYGPADLDPFRRAAGISQTVLVQAAPTLEETEYLLGLADATPWVAGVVGWVDFEDRAQAVHIRRLARHPKFLGLRPMIQDLPQDDWMLREDVQWAFDAICEADLSFNALGFPRHIPHFLELLTRFPQMRVVLDHCLKPQIRDGARSPWADGMATLAETGAYVKLSGLVTEDDIAPDATRLRPYVDHVIACFGADRVMWGSDWPVCRLRCEYAEWVALAETLTSSLSEVDKAKVWGGNARTFYRIPEIS